MSQSHTCEMSRCCEFTMSLMRYLAIPKYADGDCKKFREWFDDEDIFVQSPDFTDSVCDLLDADADSFIERLVFQHGWSDEGPKEPNMIRIYDIGPVLIMQGDLMEAWVGFRDKIPQVKNFRWKAEPCGVDHGYSALSSVQHGGLDFVAVTQTLGTRHW